MTKASEESGFVSREVGTNMQWIREMATIAAENKIRNNPSLSKYSVLYPLKEMLQAFEQAPNELELAEAVSVGSLWMKNLDIMPRRKMDAWATAVAIFRKEFERTGVSLLNKRRQIEAAYYALYLSAHSSSVDVDVDVDSSEEDG